MKTAVHLQTKEGHEFYKSVWTQYEEAKKEHHLEALKVDLWIQREKIERDLIKFLDDDTMAKHHKMDDDDSDGWAFYKMVSDQYSVLNHFYNRKS